MPEFLAPGETFTLIKTNPSPFSNAPSNLTDQMRFFRFLFVVFVTAATIATTKAI
jgi:hypothetical protein